MTIFHLMRLLRLGSFFTLIIDKKVYGTGTLIQTYCSTPNNRVFSAKIKLKVKLSIFEKINVLHRLEVRKKINKIYYLFIFTRIGM